LGVFDNKLASVQAAIDRANSAFSSLLTRQVTPQLLKKETRVQRFGLRRFPRITISRRPVEADDGHRKEHYWSSFDIPLPLLGC
jgi:hypothetical protein